MNHTTKTQKPPYTPEEQEYINKIKKRRRTLAQQITPETLDILKEQYQTNLPCYQGTQGNYDPLDAMRRDAQREVILWIESEISKHKE